MSDRSVIDWLTRWWHWWAARILVGIVVMLLGVLIFLTPNFASALGNNDSPLITMFSLLLVADGVVILVGPDKINEMAKRSRRR
jgi:hypothetical protein